MSERRKSKRWLLNAYYETYSGSGEERIGYLAELSKDGLMLLNDEPIQTNIILPLRISLNEEMEDRKEMKVVAKVVRCQKDEDLDYYNTGFKLVDASDDTREIIDQLIKINTFETSED